MHWRPRALPGEPMSPPRLCEVSAEMRDPVMELGTHGDAETVRKWASLRCPHREHCDQSRPCQGFTPENRQAISELDDKLFSAGFVKIRQETKR